MFWRNLVEKYEVIHQKSSMSDFIISKISEVADCNIPKPATF